MERFFKKTWKGIPVGIIATVLIGTAVLAGTIVGITQHVTQEITAPPIPSSITAPETIALPNVIAGESFPLLFHGEVVVYIAPEDAGKWLHLYIDPDTATLYGEPGGFMVTLISDGADNPTGNVITTFTANGVLGLASGCPAPENTLQVIEGTYTFRELICGTAGPTPGTPDVTVTLTLQDTE